MAICDHSSRENAAADDSVGEAQHKVEVTLAKRLEVVLLEVFREATLSEHLALDAFHPVELARHVDLGTRQRTRSGEE